MSNHVIALEHERSNYKTQGIKKRMKFLLFQLKSKLIDNKKKVKNKIINLKNEFEKN